MRPPKRSPRPKARDVADMVALLQAAWERHFNRGGHSLWEAVAKEAIALGARPRRRSRK